ncbi:MAG: DUF1501 domain-containing protein [Verrucomicrobiota bacterium]|nr:DUF1501 domain-containing protein [Verrucomicrobiota bacterium]MED6298951.1 DUF1501 domain-containing protein [Verrucomicrobiota bacterium]
MKQFYSKSLEKATVSRRSLLSVGGMGMLGMNVPDLLRADELASARPKVMARAKSVIFLFQWGGPSQIDILDMKPDSPKEYRSPHAQIRTTCSDIEICEHLPRMAKHMDKCTVVRTLHHKMKNHNSAGYYALTGHAPPSDDQRLRDLPDLYPAYGSVVSKFAANAGNGMPTFVSYPHVIADGSRTPGQHASFLGKKYDPLFIPRDPNKDDFKLPELSLPQGLSLDRMQSRRGLQTIIDKQSRMLEFSERARGLDDYYKNAFGMLNSTRVRNAFDISKEPRWLREKYGRSTYGQGCLLARRLAEAGVKFTTCYFSNIIGGRSKTNGGWDTHGFDNTRMYPIVEAYHLPITDQTLPTLIEDLDQRGMLDETLVVWMGEFGRTPKINKNASRDHWPQCYSVLLAGGGVKKGFVYGKSDKHASEPEEDAVTPEDLTATIYYLLGIDPRLHIFDTQDRPLMISSGEPVMDLIA